MVGVLFVFLKIAILMGGGMKCQYNFNLLFWVNAIKHFSVFIGYLCLYTFEETSLYSEGQ